MSPHVPACAGFTSGTRSRRSRTWDHLRSRGVYDRDFKAAGDVLGSSPLARGLLGPLGPADIAYGIIPARAGFTPSTRRQSRSTSGSSPLARGLRRPARPPHLHDRIIPARAGFTAARRRPGRPCRDHPRSRGVYLAVGRATCAADGSSPLARGLLGDLVEGVDPRRIIPARAGFTPTGPTPTSPRADHPRSRGVYAVPGPGVDDRPGSSPLARGLHQARLRRPGLRRIIPARAGFTACRQTRAPRARDHPRSRGVYTRRPPSTTGPPGSSPLARGLPGTIDDTVVGRRIIPARAGFTRPFAAGPGRDWDHPRSRGVYVAPVAQGQGAPGSSPLARGLRLGPAGSGAHAGIIPARAGFTLTFRNTLPLLRDHPRSRGVYFESGAQIMGDGGSSPLARGLRGVWPRDRHLGGIIPARAGFTYRPGAGSRPTRDHPRSRGVYISPILSPMWSSGSSPLARGLLAPHEIRSDGARIIPARAGFTILRLPEGALSMDHPRSRGVYIRSQFPHQSHQGSSPLARGLQAIMRPEWVRAGIIPARAGFTR